MREALLVTALRYSYGDRTDWAHGAKARTTATRTTANKRHILSLFFSLSLLLHWLPLLSGLSFLSGVCFPSSQYATLFLLFWGVFCPFTVAVREQRSLSEATTGRTDHGDVNGGIYQSGAVMSVLKLTIETIS